MDKAMIPPIQTFHSSWFEVVCGTSTGHLDRSPERENEAKVFLAIACRQRISRARSCLELDLKADLYIDLR